jgi:ParB-like chromosome segregation protein Spo0J
MGFSIKSKATQQQLLGKSAARKNALKDKTVMAAVTCAPPPANDLCPELKIVQRDIGSIQKPNRQLRRASKGKIAALARSIKALRQVAPILIDKHDRVVDGWNVVLAMRGLGADQVSCICLDHLTGEQVTAARISLNKLNEGSESDLDDLKASFEEMQLVDFDLEATGFSLQELDIILEEPASGIDADNAAEVPEAPAVPVSQLGDLWTLGEHMLLCGDALDERSYSKILGIRRADAVLRMRPGTYPLKGLSADWARRSTRTSGRPLGR